MAKSQGSGPNWFVGGFTRIENADWAHRMARNGGIAGFLLTASEAAGVAVQWFGINPTTWKATPNPAAADPVAAAFFFGTTGLIIMALTVMSWRVIIGKGYVSAALLMLLLVYEGISKLLGGTLGAMWIVVYIGLAASLFGAIRAAWYLRKEKRGRKDADLIRAFDDTPGGAA